MAEFGFTVLCNRCLLVAKFAKNLPSSLNHFQLTATTLSVWLAFVIGEIHLKVKTKL